MGCPYHLIIGWANDSEQLFALKKFTLMWLLLNKCMDLVKFIQTMQWQFDHHTCGVDLCIYYTTSFPLHRTKKIYLCYFRIPNLFTLFHGDLFTLFHGDLFFLTCWPHVTIYFQFRYSVVFSYVSISVLISTCYMNKLGDFRDLFNNYC